MLNQESCWKAVQSRDASRDGEFYFGVVTTGVYCRPGCPARHPLRKNVRFYENAAEAERDGMRQCLRCRPLDALAPAAGKVQSVCRYIEAHLDAPSDLATLAKVAGLSRFHLQRTFKAATGLTPRQYADACRMRRLRSELRTAPDVTAAVYEAGYGSASRVYERAGAELGMTPGEYRRGGSAEITYTAARTPVGLLMMAATDRGLCFVQFGETEAELVEALRAEYPGARLAAMTDAPSPAFRGWMEALESHLAGGQPRLDLPLDIRATAFQARVWKYLQSIPYGEVRSYSAVAEGIGSPNAVRAVARACSANRVALAIPCHRVIRGDGDAGGYRWGLERKQAILRREAAKVSRA